MIHIWGSVYGWFQLKAICNMIHIWGSIYGWSQLKAICNMIHIRGSVYGWSQLKALWNIWFSNLLIMSVHDESYSRNALYALYSISTFW
jgi:hypothetical protein